MKDEAQDARQQAYAMLKEFGFEEACIVKALQITTDVEQASEIALKLAD